jgi:hypothetical protein
VSPLVIYLSFCINIIVAVGVLVFNVCIIIVNGANSLIVLMRRKAVIQPINQPCIQSCSFEKAVCI